MISPVVAVLGIVTVVALLAVSAFFSSSEIAIFSLPASWVDQQSAGGDERAAVLQELSADPHRLLVTLLVGNNVVNIAISSILTVLVASVLDPGPAVVATTVVTSALILIFGEIVPKAFGLGNAESWALTVARPVRVVERVLSPLITLFDGVTRRISGLISADERIEEVYAE
jgi:CBS domain containing-hemolysin-like protein